MENIMELLPLVIPVVIIHFALAIYSLIKLKGAEKVRFDSKLVWVLIIIFINLFGSIIFLAIGRLPNEDSSDD